MNPLTRVSAMKEIIAKAKESNPNTYWKTILADVFRLLGLSGESWKTILPEILKIFGLIEKNQTGKITFDLRNGGMTKATTTKEKF